MQITNKFFTLLGLHAVCSGGTLLFLMMFPGIIDFLIGKILFSLLAIVALFDLFYTNAWNMANKEVKMTKIHNNHLKEGEVQKKPDYTKGIILGCTYALLGIILWAISFAFSNQSDGMSIMLFRAWYSEFVVVFMHSVAHIKQVSFAVSIFPALAIFFGYFCGAKSYNFTEGFINKLVYKTKKDNKSK